MPENEKYPNETMRAFRERLEQKRTSPQAQGALRSMRSGFAGIGRTRTDTGQLEEAGRLRQNRPAAIREISDKKEKDTDETVDRFVTYGLGAAGLASGLGAVPSLVRAFGRMAAKKGGSKIAGLLGGPGKTMDMVKDAAGTFRRDPGAAVSKGKEHLADFLKKHGGPPR